MVIPSHKDQKHTEKGKFYSKKKHITSDNSNKIYSELQISYFYSNLCVNFIFHLFSVISIFKYNEAMSNIKITPFDKLLSTHDQHCQSFHNLYNSLE